MAARGSSPLRMRGSVVWFNAKKGYGFIKVDGEANDLFVHYTAIEGDGYKTLEADQRVEFETVASSRGPMASKVVVLNGPANSVA